jgi:hypothetical protein
VWFWAAHMLDGGARMQTSADLEHRSDLPVGPTDANGMPNQDWIDTHPCSEVSDQMIGSRDRCNPK